MSDSPVPSRRSSGQGDDVRTPPRIVAASPRQAEALASFIAQELESWGFEVQQSTSALIVNAGCYEFMVGVARV